MRTTAAQLSQLSQIVEDFLNALFRTVRAGYGCRRPTRRRSGGASMSQIQQSVDVEVPVSVAYNQWTQFESFPHFMSGVESISQLDDTHNHWVTSIAGVQREFDTEITEQHPD